MASGDTGTYAPRSLVLPRYADMPARSANPHGMIFISGGKLVYASGASLVTLDGTVSGASVLS